MKKLLAVLLSLCLVVGLVPMMALADDAAAAEDTTAASSNWVDLGLGRLPLVGRRACGPDRRHVVLQP